MARRHARPRRRHGIVRVHPAVKMLAACLGLLLLSTYWLRVNISPSVPLGLYRLHRVPNTLVYGQIVLVDIPASLQPWWPSGMALLKPVAGLPGDVLMVIAGHFFINGEDYGLVFAQANGREFPRLPVMRAVQDGEVCVASHVPKSLDCRYSGPVPVSTLRAVATPLWTWGEEK